MTREGIRILSLRASLRLDIDPCARAEFQQVVMGLKREHKDNLGRLSRSQELALFGLRGEHAQRISEAEERCVRLEAQVRALQQEVERYKTLADIQVS